MSQLEATRPVAAPTVVAGPTAALPIQTALSDADTIVICTGGGGVPVVVDARGEFSGVKAVINKDRASALLASQLGADMFLLLTDVDSVYERHGRPAARSIVRMGPDPELAEPLDQGSMGPKVEAATRFALATGRNAGIGLIADATATLSFKAGTIVQSGDMGTEYRQ